MGSDKIKPKILVTGANGQLGCELRALATQHTPFEFIFLSHHEMPINDAATVNHLFNTLHPAYCINCAAYTAVDKAEKEKEMAIAINGEAPGILAHAARMQQCKLLHISTDYVFNGMGTVPYKETDATAPTSVYGFSKLKGEENALKEDPSTLIIRTSWVYSQFGFNFVKTMLRLMKEKETLTVVNDQQGSPTWAAGLAGALIRLVVQIEEGKKDISGIYHYCDGGITNWYEFALAIKEFTGASCNIIPVTTAEYKTDAKRPAWSALDTKKIEQKGIPIIAWKTQLQQCLKLILATGAGM
jgi:dTDP-4-dehydrorhamnose reductase